MKHFVWIGIVAACFAAAPACSSSGGGGNKKGAEVELDEAEVFLELNATDEDLGIHCFFDGEGWTEMSVIDLNAITIFKVTNGGTLSLLGSTEVFTESAEPPFDELDPDDFLLLFPEGEYTFRGTTTGGDTLVGEFEMEHQMPSMAVIVTDPEEDEVSASEDLVLTWTFDANLPGGLEGGADIERIELVVEQEDPNEVLPELVFRADLLSDVTTFTIPAGSILIEGMEVKVEIGGIGENGNKTFAEVELGEVLP